MDFDNTNLTDSSTDVSFPDDSQYNLTFMELTSLTSEERAVFSVFVIILLVCSLLSNVATLVVGVRSRKIRPFFRTCLICLATSDLLSSIFNGLTYLSQYSSDYVQIWRLGALMCSICPFITTVAILANSLILVGIAVDRYLSVIRLMRNFWETRVIYCIIFGIIIWGLPIGIATPSLTAYKHIAITIVETDPNNSSIILSTTPAFLCAASKKESARYYMILLCILFVPIAIAFIWFNSILAYEIWNRRKAFHARSPRTHESQANSCESSTTTNANQSPTNIYVISLDATAAAKKSSSTNAAQPNSSQPTIRRVRSNRDSRQLRMFFVIIMLMVMFIVFRMPVWIYLIMKFYNNYISAFHWVLQYCFGILSLFGCALNPFLYAFLTQTIHYAVIIYKKAGGCCSPARLFVRRANARNDIVLPTSRNAVSKAEIYAMVANK